jgi:hypothetical protein
MSAFAPAPSIPAPPVAAFGDRTAHSPNRKAHLKSEVFALREYFESQAFQIRGLTNAKNAEINELRDKIATREVAKAAMRREYERLGFPVRTDPKTGKSTPVDWEKEQFGEIAEFKAKLEKLQAQKIPMPQLERIDEELSGKMARHSWRRVAPVDYFVGDKRSAADKKKDAMADRKLKTQNGGEILRAPVTVADAKARADAHLERLAAKGKPDLSNLFAGYAVSPYSGEYLLKNPLTTIAFPITSAATEDYQTHIPIHNTLALSVWADLPGWKKKIHALIEASAENYDDAIAEKDKPALVKAARAELLLAQRREEAANKLCESEGAVIFRPQDWPVEVMLEIERDTTPPVGDEVREDVRRQPPNVKPAMADADAFEGDDADDE